MIKSFPLDVSHLIGWLKEKQAFSVELIDYRFHSINSDNFWTSKGIDINVFGDFSLCIRHLKGKENSRIKRTSLKVLKDFNPAQFSHIFLSVSVLEQLSLEYLMAALCLAKEIRLLYPSIKILIFGSCPKKHIKRIMENFNFVDAFLEDGCELSLSPFIKQLPLNEPLNGLSFRQNGEMVYAPAERFDVPFNDFPVPDFSLFNKEGYMCNGSLILPYEISRGCSENCFFCYFTHKNSLSHKTIGRVIADLSFLSERYETNAFHFVDGAMNSDVAYLRELCKAMRISLPHIKWSAMARPVMSYEDLKLMKDAGCVHIRWGVEYGSERMLNKIHKGTSPLTIKQTLRYSHDLGIYNYITLLTNTEVETAADIAATRQFVTEARPWIDSAQECVFRELGSFDLMKLDHLLDSSKHSLPVKSTKYDQLFTTLKLSRVDIIEAMAEILNECKVCKI